MSEKLATNDLEAFWMPFTANRQYKRAPRLFVSAERMHYTTDDGRRVLLLGPQEQPPAEGGFPDKARAGQAPSEFVELGDARSGHVAVTHSDKSLDLRAVEADDSGLP